MTRDRDTDLCSPIHGIPQWKSNRSARHERRAGVAFCNRVCSIPTATRSLIAVSILPIKLVTSPGLVQTLGCTLTDLVPYQVTPAASAISPQTVAAELQQKRGLPKQKIATITQQMIKQRRLS